MKINTENISAILEDEGDQVSLFFYNNHDEKSKLAQYALKDAYSNNKKIEIWGTFQENPTDLGTENRCSLWICIWIKLVYRKQGVLVSFSIFFLVNRFSNY